MERKRLDTARVFERVFAIYRLQAAVLLPAAVVLYLVPAALTLTSGRRGQALALAATIIAAVGYQGFVVQAVRDIQDGVRDLSLTGLFRSISKVLAPLLWTAILVGIGVFIGFLAFIIPGLVLLTQWAVAAPIVVCEVRTAPQALGRSRQLVHGHGWRVFSVLMVTFLLVLIRRPGARLGCERPVRRQSCLRDRAAGRRHADSAGLRPGVGGPLSGALAAARRAAAASRHGRLHAPTLSAWLKVRCGS